MSFHTGVYHGHVFPSNVGGREAGVQRSQRDPALEQPHGGQDLDSRHLFPQLEEISGSQHDNAEQAVPHHAERHRLLHHEVCLHRNKKIPFNSGTASISYCAQFSSPRLTVNAECPMMLVDFPMDGHICPLIFGSCQCFNLDHNPPPHHHHMTFFFLIFDFGAIYFLLCPDAYTSSEIVYTWRKGLENSVVNPPESSNLLQYDLIGQTLSSKVLKTNTGQFLLYVSIAYCIL